MAGQTPAPPRTRSGRPRRQVSPRILAAIGGLLGLIALGVVLAVVFTGGSSKSKAPARGSLAGALPGAAEVYSLLKGIPQHGNVLGSPSAPVTMAEYVDLQCPYCQQFEAEAMPSLVSRYVRTGKLKVELRPLAFIGPDSVRGRSAALAAGDQNRMFDFVQVLYVNQGTENTGWLSDSMVEAAAASIPGLDVHRLLAARGTDAVSKQASSYDAEATAASVSSTPTILVGKSGGKLREVKLSSPTDVAAVRTAIAAAGS